MMLWRKRSRDRQRLTDEQLQVAWQLCSLLVEYPTETLLGRLGLIRQAAAGLPAYLTEPIGRLADALEATPLGQLQRDYVETFDHTRRGCLYLTYFTAGDTRKRGVALVRVKQAYRRAGVELAVDELPDHLAVVLEFGASASVEEGWRLLTDYRASIEVLRISLQEKGSRWADVVLAVSRTLPDLGDDERAAVAKLIAEGPPVEDVGLEPYAIDPRLTESANPKPDYLLAGADR